MKTKAKTLISVGIDPGASVGFAVWNHEQQAIIKLETFDFWQAIENLQHLAHTYEPHEITAVIENPNLNKTTHRREHFANIRTLDRKAQNVGSNKRDAQLLIDKCKLLGFHVVEVRPKSAKKDADQFRQITKYPKRTSQHERDAGLLVFGR